MIQKNNTKENNTKKNNAKENSAKKNNIKATADLQEASTELELFAKKVLNKLIKENIYPIPYYYSIYFFNMLEEENTEFKKSVMEIIELENSNELEEDLNLNNN